MGLKVSIVTVSYNAVATIEQTIQSVINQTYDNIEYIVIDGGSTDGTVDIIKKYADRIDYWISEPDKGIYDAMNKGINQASGSIIGMINSDDWYDLRTIENVEKYFESHDDIDVIHGDIIRVKRDGSLVNRCSPFFTGEDIWHEMTVYHPTCFLCKNVYEKYGNYSLEYKIAGDYELFLRLYIKGVVFTYLKDDIVYFREDGVSGVSNTLAIREVCNISQKYGYNKIKAFVWCYIKCGRHCVSSLCTRLSLGGIVKLYHVILGHRVENVERE
ncbi:MAG: glycosyltransferase family 2 protein [Lachnospiraceae bacterium]|nr:glycosyltransferase family 2 protein [Lachnospiraceae bacterium]